MSGHSKWSTIKRKKEKTDNARAKVFTKIGREIAVAVKEGGSSDPNVNARLRDAISKAKANNVPNDNIKRVIDKASSDSSNYEAVTYEGYGPSGVAVIVETSTDNRNRTASEVRHYFDKFGGNLGQTGCVGFLFSEKGVICLDDEDEELDETKVMEDALEAGADDVLTDDGFVIYTAPADFSSVVDELTGKGYKFSSAEVEKVPSTYVKLEDEEDIRKMNLLLEHLEDNDDVINVYHNWE